MKTVYKVLYKSWTDGLKSCIKVAGNKLQIYRMHYDIYDCREILSVVPLERIQAARMIAGKKVTDRTVEEEYFLAKIENRQPLCVYCGKPLEVVQTQLEYIHWAWDPKTSRMEKREAGGDADPAECLNCSASDWDFVDYDMVNY
jgi:hypothetical protein